MTKYKAILCDVPWSYNDKGSKAHPGASHKYECMSLEAIKALPVVEALADEDAVLFFWATYPMLPEALDVIKTWGFNYKSVGFNWVKRNKVKPTGWFYGMGNWTRACGEICLLATIGKPKRVSAAVHSVIEAPWQGHSVKPDEVYNRIERLCGDVPRVELFARRPRKGWTSIGMGIDGKRIQDVLDSMIAN